MVFVFDFLDLGCLFDCLLFLLVFMWVSFMLQDLVICFILD